ncbi:UTRA domain-containing protein [Streptomyces sp. KMM 9044]|uniref:UTRA domain-containing protein n=1 Tax=Streptomyces sp. KMM 9044 TaxID=2744474 RepID=UPI00216E859D
MRSRVGEETVVRRRVVRLDGEPYELTDTYSPAAVALGARLTERRRIPGGAVTFLAERGHAGVWVREDVPARMPGAEEREILRMGQDEPGIGLSRVTLDGGGRPIQADVMVVPASRQRLRYEIRIG